MVSVFFSFVLLINYLKFFCCMIVWFRHWIILFSFGCYKLDISIFSHIFLSYSRICIIHKLFFLKILFFFCPFFRSAVFVSMYGFNKTSWLTLCTFLKTNPQFNDCLKFLMYITYSFSSCKLARTFLQLFQFSFF